MSAGAHDGTVQRISRTGLFWWPTSRHALLLYCSIARTRHAANGEQLAGPSAQARRTTRSLATEGIREKAQAGPSPGVVIRGGLFALSLTFAQPHPRASAAVLVDEDHAGGF